MAGPAAPQMSANQAAAQAQQQNLAARVACLSQSLNIWQPIYSQTFANPTPGTVINVPIRQAGFTKKFWIEILASVNVGAAETQTRTDLGPANLLSNVTLNDLSNYTRINTTGWHLWMLQSMKQGFFSGAAGLGMGAWQPAPSIFGTAFTNDAPMNAGSGAALIKAPASFTTAQANGVRMVYEVPCSYSDVDLRGAIYTSVVSATMNLQMTLNPNFFVASGADNTLAGYQSSTATLGTITSITITVHQNYLDQLPFTNNGPILPAQDLSKMYLLTNTSFSALTSGQDFPIPFPNFRAWQSLSIIYDNAGTRTYGTDISLFQLQTANLTNILQYDPQMQQLRARIALKDDWVPGMYMFDFRDRPINTNNYGNMQLTVRPSGTVNAGANILAGFEGIGIANQVVTAGSIPAS
jgi:hypothetical protein